MVYTIEAKNGFPGVHHGRGFWIFMVYTMAMDLWNFVVYTMKTKNSFRGVHHGS